MTDKAGVKISWWKVICFLFLVLVLGPVLGEFMRSELRSLFGITKE